MKAWKVFYLCILFLSAFSTAQEVNSRLQSQHQIFLKYNEKSPFIFIGKIDVNKANGAATPILYPGDNALIFFTAILAHAAINSGIDHSRLSKEQEDANKVFDDYQPYIQKFNNTDSVVIPQLKVALAEKNTDVVFLTDKNLKSGAQWEMDVSPIFFMTQNLGSLILYNKILLQENFADDSKKPKKTASSNKKTANKNERIVVVISDPIAIPDYKHFWSDNEGSQFLDTLKKMYKESLSLVIANRLGNQRAEGAEQITVRYMEDGVKKVERGYVISSDCKRTLFESLSGEIKSVPNLDFLSCPSSV